MNSGLKIKIAFKIRRQISAMVGKIKKIAMV